VLFTVTDRFGYYPNNTRSQVFLTWDDWNDFSFYTLFGIFYVNDEGDKIELGSIKIGFIGQEERDRVLKKKEIFSELSPNHFSVGLDDNYYVNLNKLGPDIQTEILNGLNDIAKNTQIFRQAAKESVFKISFLRGLSQTTIEGQFRRLANGAARLTPYHFTYTSPENEKVEPMTLSFDVEPDSLPSTNIHILIGRNGVGKTYMIDNMIDALIKRAGNERTTGKFNSLIGSRSKLFANLICVTFSAFDDFEHPPEKKDKSTGIQYAYIGLKSINADGIPSDTQNSNLLMEEFHKSLYICKTTSKTQRWKDVIKTLETDPIFRAADIGSLINLPSEAQIRRVATPLLKKLSSGHKLILLTITRLVEKLEERSLVLIDEPESHLHPPLLSSFMRALNALLTNRNGVGIIATHSPVVLQEVPRSCVWKLRRNGTEAVAERLQIESFGENVGILTQEVFGLEVTDSGFHNLLKDLVEKYRTYEAAIEILDGQLGLEAKAILRTLFFQKRNNDRNR